MTRLLASILARNMNLITALLFCLELVGMMTFR